VAVHDIRDVTARFNGFDTNRIHWLHVRAPLRSAWSRRSAVQSEHLQCVFCYELIYNDTLWTRCVFRVLAGGRYSLHGRRFAH